MAILLPFMLLLTQLLFPQISLAADTITQHQNLTDGNTLVSKSKTFELGFFNPGNSSNRYLGIWYHKIPVKTIVWVANRDNPIKGPSGTLMTNEGKLVLLSQNKTVVWSGNSKKKVLNPTVQLLDSGNLVLRDNKDESPENYLWQSFDYPSDTLLPGMKLGWDLKTGLNRRVSAWKNWDDPSPGDFIWGLVLEGSPELKMWKGSAEYFRSGPWNGLGFSGAPELKNNPLFKFEFVSNKDEVYYSYNLKSMSMISRVVMNQTTYSRQRFIWIEEAKTWRLYASAVPRDGCDSYNICGPNGNCTIGESPICRCLTGFKPKSPENWDLMDWTKGCKHSKELSCQDKDKDGFVKFSGLKYPDCTHAWVNGSMNLMECRDKCFSNCSCTAYANTDIREGGSGCIMWFGDLVDLRQFTGDGPDLYIRMQNPKKARKGVDKMKVVPITIGVASAIVVILILSYACKIMKRFRDNLLTEKEDEGRQEDMDLPFFDFVTISNATNGFTNKLGEGGFGPVYKGTLSDGQEIAVKRLSRNSIQGIQEFKNEVLLCSKLQHRNLVKILGCCIRGEEKMLIYEYMPNKSLDHYLFDSTKSKILDWNKRFNILCGIARGLLYLHQDSRLRVIHRDLKASNILLDNDLNPKISDFGLAKMFGGDQAEGNTNKVVGTRGYMAPEYAIDGTFSTKSNIFSFGILLLEIVSGRKNRVVYNSNHNLNLISHAWRLWKEGSIFELIDDCLRDSIIVSEVLRYIHIGLLCLQHHPDDRPSMASVVMMLSNSSVILSEPKEPGFLLEKVSSVDGESSSSMKTISSINEMSWTAVSSR